ncbi:MAG: hypothetical protein ACHQIG_11870 [Acidimicrobiia bacterium]
MFIQVVKGTVVDPDGFRSVGERWDTDVRPAAEGYLGTTVGTTADGRFFVASRWESADAAAKNNDRPEQTAWFEALAPTVSDLSYNDCSTVLTMGGGGSDDAGFVQVMVGKIKDRAKFEALNGRIAEMDAAFSSWRDDVLGDVLAVHDDGTGFHDIVYFTSESAARAGERKEPTPEVQAFMAEMEAAADIEEFLDLQDLMLR